MDEGIYLFLTNLKNLAIPVSIKFYQPGKSIRSKVTQHITIRNFSTKYHFIFQMWPNTSNCNYNNQQNGYLHSQTRNDIMAILDNAHEINVMSCIKENMIRYIYIYIYIYRELNNYFDIKILMRNILNKIYFYVYN